MKISSLELCGLIIITSAAELSKVFDGLFYKYRYIVTMIRYCSDHWLVFHILHRCWVPWVNLVLTSLCDLQKTLHPDFLKAPLILWKLWFYAMFKRHKKLASFSSLSMYFIKCHCLTHFNTLRQITPKNVSTSFLIILGLRIFNVSFELEAGNSVFCQMEVNTDFLLVLDIMILKYPDCSSLKSQQAIAHN